MVDVNVKEETLWPNSSQNVVFEALKNSRVSFVILLIIVVGIYIGMFFLLEKNQNKILFLTKISGGRKQNKIIFRVLRFITT